MRSRLLAWALHQRQTLEGEVNALNQQARASAVLYGDETG
jgi:Flp pilus assembly protein TadB